MKTPIITALATYSIIGICIYFIVLFFNDYEFIYLLAGTIVPISMIFISSRYLIGNLSTLLVISAGIIGFINFTQPYDLLFLSIALNLSLFKVIRISNKISTINLDQTSFFEAEISFLKELLNSDWYNITKGKKVDLQDVDELTKQNFYQIYVKRIIKLIINNNSIAFKKSKYDIDILLRIHAICTVYCLPIPIIKNPDGLISIGTQMVLNILNNIEEINYFDALSTENLDENIYIKSANQLMINSEVFGEITNEELDRIKI